MQYLNAAHVLSVQGRGGGGRAAAAVAEDFVEVQPLLQPLDHFILARELSILQQQKHNRGGGGVGRGMAGVEAFCEDWASSCRRLVGGGMGCVVVVVVVSGWVVCVSRGGGRFRRSAAAGAAARSVHPCWPTQHPEV